MYRLIGVFMAAVLVALTGCSGLLTTPTAKPPASAPTTAPAPTRVNTPSPALTSPAATIPAVTASPKPGATVASPSPSAPPAVKPTVQPTVAASPSAPPPPPTPTPVQYLLKGGTLPEVAGSNRVSFTFRYWNTRDHVAAMSQGTYYVFVAKPGTKFIIVSYLFKNDSNVQQQTPGVNSGEVTTKPNGYVYKLWAVPSGAAMDQYRPNTALGRDIAETGASSGGDAKLLPGESVEGRVIFEMPSEMVPTDIALPFLPVRISLAE